MVRLKTLIIHPALAPYRIDLFNRVAAEVDLDLVFQRPQVAYHQDLNQRRLRSLLKCPYSDLDRNLVVMKRDIPWGIRRLLRERRPDVVVTSEFSLPSVLAITGNRSGSRGFGHVIWTDENPHTLADHGRVRHGLRRFCAHRADALIMCSEEIVSAFARRYALDPKKIFGCAVHQDPATLRARLRDSATAALERIECLQLRGRKIVLFVGRLVAVKNLGLALRAFKNALAHDPSMLFVLAGSGEERGNLEQLSRELGIDSQVHFAGHDEGESLFAWYRLASVLLLSSTYEPYGAVINEALVCGVPVVCTHTAGAVRLVREGTNGYSFSPFALGELTDRLARLAPAFVPAGTLATEERPDLMPVSFEDDVNGLLDAIHYAAAAHGRARFQSRQSQRAVPVASM